MDTHFLLFQIYFKAWKELDGQALLAFENNCIQDFMGHAVHASNPSLFKSLYRILESFHTEKRLPAVENLLLRLYEPILWRSLKAANPIVRRNAASLFVSVFPLQVSCISIVESKYLVFIIQCAYKNLVYVLYWCMYV